MNFFSKIFPRSDRTPVLALIVLCALFLWDFLSGVNCFYYTDFSDRWIPWLQFVKRAVMSGQSFLWNPDLMLGFPLFAESEAGALYPVNRLIFLFMEAQYGVSVVLFLHLSFCAVCAYKLARKLAISKEGSFLSAVAYTFCGSLTAQTTNYIITLAACYAPAMFYLLICYMESSEFRYLMWFGIALGIQLFICHIQTTFILYTACTIFFVFLTFRRSPSFSREILRYAGVSVFAAGLAAVQLLPLYELTGLSVRSGGLDYEYLTGYSLRPWDYLSMLFPWMYGNARAGSFIGNWYFEETHVYAGVTGFVFAVAFFLYRRGSLSKAQAGFLLIMATAFILSLGRYIPVVDLYSLLQHIPGFYYFRCPARWSFIVMLCAAVFGGLGFDAAMSRLSEKNAKTLLLPALLVPAGTIMLWPAQLSGVYGDNLISRALTGAHVLSAPANVVEEYVISPLQKVPPLLYLVFVCLLLLLFMIAAIRGLMSMKAAKTAFLTLAVLDIFLMEAPQNPRRPMDYFPKKTAALAPVVEKAGGGRVMPVVPQTACDLPDINYLCGNSPTYFGLRVPTGTSPLILRSYKEMTENMSVSLLESAGVKLIIRPYYDPELKSFHYETEELRSSLPRAFTAGSVRTADFPLPGNIFRDENRELLRSSVVLSAGDFKSIADRHPDSVDLLKNSPAVLQSAEILSYENGEVAVGAVATSPSLLVLTDMNYPGWQAEVNGKRTEVYPAYGVFRSVFLPGAGAYKVIFSFRPFSFYLGGAISLASVLIAGMYLIVSSRTKRHDRG